MRLCARLTALQSPAHPSHLLALSALLRSALSAVAPACVCVRHARSRGGVYRALPRSYADLYSTCYNMCTQRSPFNWSKQLYERHSEVRRPSFTVCSVSSGRTLRTRRRKSTPSQHPRNAMPSRRNALATLCARNPTQSSALVIQRNPTLERNATHIALPPH